MTASFVELVIDGPSGWDLGFVRGFLHGRGLAGKIYNAEKEGFDCESIRENIRELLKGTDTAHLLVPEELVDTVKEAMEASGKAGYPMTLRHERKIEGAGFSFSFETYSREFGDKIRNIFDQKRLGSEVKVDCIFEEKTDPDAEGVELYAPTHHYELTGHGDAKGSIPAVVDLYRKCRNEDLIKTPKAELLAESPIP